MQKSIKITIGIIFLILTYSMIASAKLVTQINSLYLYIINPIFWIALAIFLRITLNKQISSKKLKKQIIEYCLIAGLTYVIIYLLSGLFVTFGKNPYSTKLTGIIINLWIFATVIIAKEYVRYKLINNVYDKDKYKIALLISAVYVLIDLELNRFVNTNITALYMIKIIMQNIIPSIGRNLLYSYICMNTDCIPSILYELITMLYLWVSPILPNSPWIMTSVIDTSIPIILFLYIRYTKNKTDIFKTKEKLLRTDPRNIIPVTIVIVLAIWFAIGVFPMKPVAIATGSMEPKIEVGDIVIIKKCNVNDIEVNDIIEYQMEGYTVIHRVIEKNQSNGQYTFITKGDNNNVEDLTPVKEEQLIGKCVFQIKYLGYPAVWLRMLHVNEQVAIQTGN